MGFSRILFRFAKEGEARFLSHRDLMRAFERALRRAGLPVRMTEGFNPHPKLSIPAALPVGVEASDEVLEVEFASGIGAAAALERLGAQLPGGLSLRSALALPEGARARVESVAYEAELPPGCAATPADVERLMRREAIPVQRGRAGRPGRELDMRPALRALSVEEGRLRFELAVSDAGTPRPTEVLAALLGADAEALHQTRLRRTRVNLLLARPHRSATRQRHEGA